MYVSRTEVPTLQVLTGHGELTTADLAHMTSFLSSNSYDVQRVSAAELNTQYPLLIACPQFDLTQEELEELLHFAQKGGNFLVLSRFSDPAELPRFGELFLYFGLRVLPGLCVAEAEDKGSYWGCAWLTRRIREAITTILPLSSPPTCRQCRKWPSLPRTEETSCC